MLNQAFVSTAAALKFALIFMSIEFATLTLLGRKKDYNFKETLVSMQTLILSQSFYAATVFILRLFPSRPPVAHHFLSLERLHGTIHAIALFVVIDFACYWRHRFNHATRIGWVTHSVHHNPRHFNISLGYRLGPLDAFFSIYLMYVPLALLGVPAMTVFYYHSFVLMYQYFCHLDTKASFGWLEYVLISPRTHQVHHSSKSEDFNKNFGAVFSVFDRVFGTYKAFDGKTPIEFGTAGETDPESLYETFFKPFVLLGRDIRRTPGLRNKILFSLKSPSNGKIDENKGNPRLPEEPAA